MAAEWGVLPGEGREPAETDLGCTGGKARRHCLYSLARRGEKSEVKTWQESGGGGGTLLFTLKYS